MPIFQPNSLSVFEPQNPEHAILDGMIQEAYEVNSTEILWFSFLKGAAEATQDDIDKMFGETTKNNDASYAPPKRVWANNSVNPILIEVTRLGGQTIKDIDLFCGIAAMNEYLEGKTPRPGDVFRITRLGLNPQIDRDYDFYVVSHAWPIDLYNNRYTSWQIAAEQTNLEAVPVGVKCFLTGE